MKSSQALIGLTLFAMSFVYSSCANSSSATRYEDQLDGVASYYADDFHRRRTSSGELYDMHSMTAAHRTLPFQTTVRVTNLDNGRKVDLRINDRGPFKDNRVIDVSYKAALELGMISNGTAPVVIEILQLGSPLPK